MARNKKLSLETVLLLLRLMLRCDAARFHRFDSTRSPQRPTVMDLSAVKKISHLPNDVASETNGRAVAADTDDDISGVWGMGIARWASRQAIVSYNGCGRVR